MIKEEAEVNDSKIKLPINYVRDLESIARNDTFLFFRSGKHKTDELAFFACLYRIEDTVAYLESRDITAEDERVCANGFIDFLSRASTMIGCIDRLIGILDAGHQIKAPNIIFTEKTITDAKGLHDKLDKRKRYMPYVNEDDLYFDYIRSVGSVHPNDTSHHRCFQQYKRESSPYVALLGPFNSCNCVVHFCVYGYNNTEQNSIRSIDLRISSVYDYVRDRYNRLTILKDILQQRIQNTASEFRTQQLKSEDQFSSRSNYLQYLQHEADQRIKNFGFYFEWTNKIIDLSGMPEQIRSRYSRYCNALKYGVEQAKELVQNCEFEKLLDDDLLIAQLHIPDISVDKDKGNVSYLSSKVIGLYDINSCSEVEIENLRYQALELYKSFREYALVDLEILEGLDHLQLLATLNTALYFYCLSHDTPVNRAIPNNEIYRQCTLNRQLTL